ncbi:MAG TPA: acyltransferase [Verrucomicrobiae bacterium]|nr:acyltransferase [Verrucomicrobiae bacterium]
MGQGKKGYLPTLDGWRTVAILAVIIDHVVAYEFHTDSSVLMSVTRIGPNGVSLFFAISGFLICSRLLEEHEATGRISLSGFYIRRASRILPPAMTYLIIIGILGLTGWILVSPLEWWSCVFFFRNYLPRGAITSGWGGYTIHYWSLAVEEHFYLIWPTLLVLSGPKKSRWVAGGLALVVACWRSWDFRHQIFASHVPGVLFASRTDTRLDGLLMGCLAALLLADSRWRERFLRIMRPWMWAACVAVYLGLQILFRRHYYTLFESVLLAVIVATTVLRPETWVARLLELSWMRWIGRLSYSLYLWQQFFLEPGAKSPLSQLQRFPVNLVLLFAVAALSYRFVERPLIRLGHRLAPPPSPGRQDAEPVAREEDQAPVEDILGTGPGEAA